MGALDTLLGLKSPVNMNSTGDPYLDSRRSSMYSGEMDYEPSELELMDEQMARGDSGGSPYGVTMSRDRIRDSKMQETRRALRLDDREHAQAMERTVVPAEIQGRYRAQASENSAQTALEKLLLQQQQQTRLQEDRQTHDASMLDERIAAALGKQNDQQAFKQETAKAPGLSAIASRRQMLQKAVADPKNQPGWWERLTNAPNQYQQQLDSFDYTLGTAQEWAQKYPTQSVEEIIAAEGAHNIPPEDKAQLSEFLLLLRGR